MRKVVRLTERDLTRIVKRVIRESEMDDTSMDEHINWDIKSMNCEGSRFGNTSSMGVDKDEDGNIIVFIRYCDGDEKELNYLKRKARYEISTNYSLPPSPNEDDTLSERYNRKRRY